MPFRLPTRSLRRRVSARVQRRRRARGCRQCVCGRKRDSDFPARTEGGTARAEGGTARAEGDTGRRLLIESTSHSTFRHQRRRRAAAAHAQRAARSPAAADCARAHHRWRCGGGGAASTEVCGGRRAGVSRKRALRGRRRRALLPLRDWHRRQRLRLRRVECVAERAHAAGAAVHRDRSLQTRRFV